MCCNIKHGYTPLNINYSSILNEKLVRYYRTLVLYFTIPPTKEIILRKRQKLHLRQSMKNNKIFHLV